MMRIPGRRAPFADWVRLLGASLVTAILGSLVIATLAAWMLG